MGSATALPTQPSARWNQLLSALQRSTAGIQSVTLASADGLSLSSTLRDPLEADRLAAMASSMSGLASALSRESGHGEPVRLILESAEGLFLAMSVPRSAGPMVLAVVTTPQALLGKLLWNCRHAAGLLADG